MLSKLSILGLALSAIPFVSAVQFQVPENPDTESPVTIKWTVDAADPGVWSLELIHVEFNRAFAIANNVDPSLGQITITLPSVPPGPGYTLEAVNIGDISQVYGTSATFTIGEHVSASESATPSDTPSGGAPSKTPGNPGPTPKPPTQSPSQFGTVVKPTNQPSAPGNSNQPSGSGSNGAGPQPSSFNNGGMKTAAGYFIVAASALVGALVVGA